MGFGDGVFAGQLTWLVLRSVSLSRGISGWRKRTPLVVWGPVGGTWEPTWPSWLETAAVAFSLIVADMIGGCSTFECVVDKLNWMGLYGV